MNSPVSLSGMSRKDWDYVSMADYSKDTEQLVAIANAVADELRREIAALKLTFAAAVHTMGEVKVSNDSMIFADTLSLVRYERPDLNETIWRVEKP